MAKEPKFNKDGSPCQRGLSAGSQANWFASDDGRRRPGKPKGARDHKKMIAEIRDMPTAIKNKRGKKIPTERAILLVQRQKALAGDRHAVAYLERKFAQIEPIDVAPDLTKALLAEDADILASARQRGLLGPSSDEAAHPEADETPPGSSSEGEAG